MQVAKILSIGRIVVIVSVINLIFFSVFLWHKNLPQIALKPKYDDTKFDVKELADPNEILGMPKNDTLFIMFIDKHNPMKTSEECRERVHNSGGGICILPKGIFANIKKWGI